ncbi:nucleotidyltransferase domain-containing protein [Petroclostridium sp. X23]|uniref:nucleotidyltransferase domain-containing protein n=1 Tax=Petroclostridium sp. X23 TaxID=3045146 RepID=UPI0024AE04F2|nr:nucleotidyltransferase domain-containing protein [Petroclostridium sp. X23]WHH59487.1 nucleotidyltransferase domain-containing protein [Petroclostridium sp. X23]
MAVLSTKTQEEVKEITSEFVRKVKPVFGDKFKKVILFGSYARGDYDAESDIDILVMVDEDDTAIRKYKHDIIEIDSEINMK